MIAMFEELGSERGVDLINNIIFDSFYVSRETPFLHMYINDLREKS